MRTSLIFWACSMLRVTIGLAFFLNLRKMMIGGDVVGFKFNGCFHPLRRYILFRPPWWAFHVSGSRRKQKQQKRSPRFVLVPFINNLPHNCHYNNYNEGVNFYCCPLITVAFIPHIHSLCLLPSPLSSYNIINIAITMRLSPRWWACSSSVGFPSLSPTLLPVSVPGVFPTRSWLLR